MSTRMVWNIFRKDVRHLRLELVASLAVVLIFNLIVPRSWGLRYDSPDPMLQLAGTLPLLLFAAWAILILRLVQGERLAGLNQWWVTRPYRWPELLAAKGLFLLVFLYVPLVLSQLYLLGRAGLMTGDALAELLRSLVFLTATMFLPMMCVAAVTTSFAQTALVLVGIAAAGAALTTGFTFLGSVSATFGVPRRPPLYLAVLQAGIALVFCGAALVVQYRRRQTRRSSVLLAAAAVLVVVVGVVLDGSPLAASGYAMARADAPARVAIDTSKSDTFSLILPRNPRTAVYRIPLLFSEMAPGVIVSREAQRYTLTAADGSTWTSNWISDNADFGGLAPERSKTSVGSRSFIDIPWSVNDRFVGRPVAMHIEFLVSELEDGAADSFPMTTKRRSVPDVGACSLDEGEGYVSCLTAFGAGNFATAKSLASPDPCEDADGSPAGSPTNPIPVSGFLLGRVRSQSVVAGAINPVVVNPVILRARRREERPHLCPGESISFVVKRFRRRLRLETADATVVLKDRVDVSPQQR